MAKSEGIGYQVRVEQIDEHPLAGADATLSKRVSFSVEPSGTDAATAKKVRAMVKFMSENIALYKELLESLKGSHGSTLNQSVALTSFVIGKTSTTSKMVGEWPTPGPLGRSGSAPAK